MSKKQSIQVLNINFDITNHIHFVVYSVWINLEDYGTNNSIKKQHALIALKNNLTSHPVIHPISDFILSHWKHKSYNTMKVHSQNLAGFLNYLLKHQRKIKVYTLKDLCFHHASDFLNYLTINKKSRSTVLSYRATLTYFYVYLAKKGICAHTLSEFESLSSSHGFYKNKYLPPFEGVILPSQSKSYIEHHLPEIYILRLLELASIVSPSIALGVYMQIFGGLRVGEVVNIKRSDVKTIGPYGVEGLLLNIEKGIFRTDIRDTSGSSYVKKSRDQLILGFREWLKDLYKLHCNNFVKGIESEALFINKNGKPMTGASYRYYFNNLKKAFINYLKSSDNPNDKIASISLSNSKWSTHIGRGIFTNIIAESAQNPQDIALLRGDDNIASSLDYMSNTKRMKKNLESHLELMLNPQNHK
ncbi:tyrosine-type recombinase/integrase [Priestia megaterium]|uniref:tyrosine-type recombinase/integrase n=1 Tax=Priestia megaterium TaxID=1404 RepID=UPI001E5E3CF5|nr:site-specific integrase [Priestia megaterium]